ncbi:MAG TPA: hypothetical protein PK156_22855, partial [Polyangium sp.]|nr:hypothetical protein [Polyangium sp.]
HVILGGSNLLFFQGAFVALGMQRFGAVITSIHFAFVLAQAIAAVRIPHPALDQISLQKN